MEEDTDHEAQSDHGTLRQFEVGSVIAPNDQVLVDLSKTMCPFIFKWIVQKINIRNIRGSLKEVVS